jgi:hypothetical protein
VANPYYESAGRAIDEGKVALLNAVAQGGEAGKKTYEEGLATLGAARQQALSEAAKRSAITGVTGTGTEAIEQPYATGQSLLTTGNQAFQNYLTGLGAAGSKYLEGAKSGLGALEAINIGKAQAQEATIKGSIEAARLRAEAEAAKEQARLDAQSARDQKQFERQLLRDQLREEARAAREKTKLPTANLLLGQGEALKAAAKPVAPVDFGPGQRPGESTAQYLARLEQAAGQRRTQEQIAGAPTPEVARMIAKNMGLDEGTVNSILTPQIVNQYLAAVKKGTPPPQLPPPPDKRFAQSLGYSSKRADEILSAPEVEKARSFVATLALEPLDAYGRIKDDPQLRGLTPSEVFNKWLDDPGTKGIRSMKDTLRKYYLPWIQQNLEQG